MARKLTPLQEDLHDQLIGLRIKLTVLEDRDAPAEEIKWCNDQIAQLHARFKLAGMRR